jgi:hypothetical protein
MVGSRVTARLSGGTLVARRNKPPHASGIDTVTVTGFFGVNPSIPSGDPASLDISKANNSALGKFNRRIIEVNTAFKGGIFLGELAQTLRTIKNPAIGLRRTVDDWYTTASGIRRRSSQYRTVGGLRRLPVRELLRRTRQNLADAWLEAQFGWRPLLSDIDDGCKALAILNTGQSLHTGRITARGVADGNSSIYEEPQGSSIAQWISSLSVASHVEVIYRGAVRLEARNPAQMKAELLGFNPASWLPTVWELTPWSFLIDYFTNIGEIVEGWSALFTRLAWCNRTVRSNWVHTYGSRVDAERMSSHHASHCRSFAQCQGVITKSSVSRLKIEGTSVPGFQFEIPGFGSLKRLNIAALVAARNGDRSWSLGD